MLLIISAGIVGFLLFLFSINGSAKTITVDDDGGGDYVTIQDAIENATDGDTVRVFEGVYEENIEINIAINLIGNGSSFSTIHGSESGPIVKIDNDWIHLTGFTISGSENVSKGIIVNSNNVTISHNSISSHTGIALNHAHDNSIFDNTFLDCEDTAIILENSIGNTIRNNQFQNTTHGIEISSSDSTRISGNVLKDIEDGIDVQHSVNVVVLDNEISGAEQNGISIRYCDQAGVRNNTCINSTIGLEIKEGANNHIDSNQLGSNSQAGIFILDSIDNRIMNNTITSNYAGIEIYNNMELSVGGNRIHYNWIVNNSHYGIYFWGENIEDIDARHNWWGDETGPQPGTLYPQGGGEENYGTIYVDPWLKSDDEIYSDADERNEEDDEGHDIESLYLPIFVLLLLVGVLFILVITLSK